MGSAEKNVTTSKETAHPETEAPARSQSMRHSEADGGEGGRIKSVRLVDFMCHRHLEVQLHECINILVGANGSGKSAVLTALAVCLGGRASKTQRADSAADLIREGASQATVTVSIGHGAALPLPGAPVDASEIVVERTLRRAGPAGYRVWAVRPGGQRAEIGRRAEDVQAVVEHYALFVDNPVLLLTQETAKRFLAAARPAELYSFFMRGTQLEQLRVDHEYAAARVAAARDALSAAERGADATSDAVEALRTRLAELESLRTLHDAVRVCEDELARAVVAAAEAERAGASNTVEAELRAVAAAADQVAVARERVAALSAERASAEASIAESTQTSASQSTRGGGERRRSPLDESIAAADAADARVETLRSDINEARTELGRLTVEEARCRARADSQPIDKDGAATERRTRAEAQRTNADATLRSLNTHAVNAAAEIAAADARLDALQGEITEAQQRASEADRCLAGVNAHRATLRTTSVDRMRIIAAQSGGSGAQANGGDRLAAVVRELATAPGFRDDRRPVGPVGAHLRLTDRRWMLAMDVALSGIVDAFVVDNHADAARVREIIRRHGLRCPVVKIPFAGAESLNVTANAPDPRRKLTTALDVLEIDSAVVRKALIISRGIERVVLVADRAEAMALAREHARNVGQIFTEKLRLRAGMRSVTASALVSHPAGSVFATADEHAARIADRVSAAERASKEAGVTLAALLAQRNEARRAKSDAETAVAALSSRQRDARAALRDAEDVIRELEESATGLGGAVAFARTEAERLRAQMAEIDSERARLEDELAVAIRAAAQCADAMKAARAEARAAESRRTAGLSVLRRVDSELTHATTAVATAQATEARAMRSLEAARMELAAAETQLAAAQAALESRPSAAEGDSNVAAAEIDAGRSKRKRNCPTRSIDEVQKELRDLRARLDARMQTGDVGDPHALRAELVSLSARHEAARRAVASNAALAARLDAVLADRRRVWAELRRGICLKSATDFVFLLLVREFQGVLEYDHDARELAIRIVPHANATVEPTGPAPKRKGRPPASQIAAATGARDIRQLSGGERSYGTSCFMCSLWPAIGSQFRALDEFDVFMDPVNRSVILELLVDAARRSGLQFLLITPNSVPHALIAADDVRLHTMRDPERGALA